MAILPFSNAPTVLRETLGTTLRSGYFSAQNNNPWLKPPMQAGQPWQPSTAYRISDTVINQGWLWTCQQNGTSSATLGGPSASVNWNVIDGTTAWIKCELCTTTSDQYIIPSGWLQSTAYSLGNTIFNANGVYGCVAAGTSAASGNGPSGTGGAITDGTVSWTYMGPNKANGNIGNMPLYSLVSSTPGLMTNVYNPQTTLGAAAVTFPNCSILSNSGTNEVNLLSYKPTATSSLAQGTAEEFESEADKIYIRQPNSAVRFQLFIDYGAGWIRFFQGACPFNSNTNNFHVFDFSLGGGGSKKRKYRIEATGLLGSTGFKAGTIGVNTVYSVSPRAAARPTGWLIMDSIGQGDSASGPFWVANKMNLLLSWALGIDFVDGTQGGTGHLDQGTNPDPGGTSSNYFQRIQQNIGAILASNPSMILLMGSSNDVNSGTPAQVTAQVLLEIAYLRAQGYKNLIVYGGIWYYVTAAPPFNPGSTIPDYENAISAAVSQWVTQTGDTLVKFFPVATSTVPIPTTAQNNANNTNSLSSTTWVNTTDNLHPTDIGWHGYGLYRVPDLVYSNAISGLR